MDYFDDFTTTQVILIYAEKLIFVSFSLRFNYGVAPRGLVRGDILPGSVSLARRFTPGYLWCRPTG